MPLYLNTTIAAQQGYHYREPIRDRIRKAFDKGWIHYKDFNKRYDSNPFAKSLPYFFKTMEKIQYIAEIIFETFMPEKKLEGIFKEIKEYIVKFLSARSKIISIYKKTVNFWALREIPLKIEENVAERKEGKKTKNSQKTTVNLRTISLVSKIFAVPETIYKFSGLFLNIHPFFKSLNAVTNSISLLLSTANLFSHSNDCSETKALLNKLKIFSYRAFIKQSQRQLKLPYKLPALNKLTSPQLKKIVDTIKHEQAKAGHTNSLIEAKHAGRKAFINNLNRLIKTNPKLIKRQFKVTFQKCGYPGDEAEPTNSKNFFMRMALNYVQNDQERTNKIVKTLKLRLGDKIFSQKYSLVYGSVGLIPSSMESAIALSAIFASNFAIGITLSPVAAAFTGSLAIAKIFIIFYNNHRKHGFIESMEHYTAPQKQIFRPYRDSFQHPHFL